MCASQRVYAALREMQDRCTSQKKSSAVCANTETLVIMLGLAQAWENYGLGAICGPIGFSIRPAEFEDIVFNSN